MIAKDLQNIHLNAKAIPNKIYKSRDDNGKIIYYIGTADRRLFPYNPTVKEVAKIIEIKEKLILLYLYLKQILYLILG